MLTEAEDEGRARCLLGERLELETAVGDGEVLPGRTERKTAVDQCSAEQ